MCISTFFVCMFSGHIVFSFRDASLLLSLSVVSRVDHTFSTHEKYVARTSLLPQSRRTHHSYEFTSLTSIVSVGFSSFINTLKLFHDAKSLITNVRKWWCVHSARFHTCVSLLVQFSPLSKDHLHFVFDHRILSITRSAWMFFCLVDWYVKVSHRQAVDTLRTGGTLDDVCLSHSPVIFATESK